MRRDLVLPRRELDQKTQSARRSSLPRPPPPPTPVGPWPSSPAGRPDAHTRTMIEVICNDRLGKKIRVKCNPDDTVGDLKKLLAAQIGTRSEKLRIQKWYTVYKDHISLEDYEIHDGMGLELYYN